MGPQDPTESKYHSLHILQLHKVANYWVLYRFDPEYGIYLRHLGILRYKGNVYGTTRRRP
jgi:hypothetical protein